MVSFLPPVLFVMQDYSFVHFSEDKEVNDSVTSNPPQTSALNAKSSCSFNFPSVTTATSRLQSFIFMSPNRYFSGDKSILYGETTLQDGDFCL